MRHLLQIDDPVLIDKCTAQTTGADQQLKFCMIFIQNFRPIL